MSYYDDDFYHEPSEFESLIDELKESLAKSVKEEFVAELERLKKENTELQSTKRDFEQIKNEYRAKESQLEYERSDMERRVRKERLSVLMKDFEVVMYKTDYKNELPPKCNKCDDGRKIHYKTPLGKDDYEICDCSKGLRVYYPEEFICSEFRINNHGNGMRAWYKLKPGSDDDYAKYNSSTFAETIYNDGLKFEDLEMYSTFFKTKEECQKYCDYLNDKKEGES